MPSRTFRVGIIGDTLADLPGGGGYGHQVDMAFVGVEGAEIVAVADADDEGRSKAMVRTGAPRGYADYNEMLRVEKPDIAVVASRLPGDHLEPVVAAALNGASAYMEKPCAATHGEVDRMMAAHDAAGTVMVVAHPWRGHPPIQKYAIPWLKEGKIGEVRYARMIGNQQPGEGLGYGNGDELMLDRNPHMFDLIWQIFGAPAWCHAHITQDGRSVTPDDVVEGPENYGLVAGNGIKVYYAWENGFAADFESIEGEGKDRTWRIDFHGTEGTISIPGAIGPGPDVFYNPSSQPRLVGDDRWEILPTEPPPDDFKWVNSHHRMARSMMDILEGKEPEYELVQGPQARLYLEMAMAAHASHIAGARIYFPLEETNNPFDTWTA